MRRAEIQAQDRYLAERQRQLRLAADVVTDAWARFPEVAAVAVIGSVAKPLWKEVPRFSAYRRAVIEVWHECKDVDLALWLDSQAGLGALRRAAVTALRNAEIAGRVMGVASHNLDVFLFEPATDIYLGRLCKFSTCPKGKRDCLTPGCGAIPFNKVVDGFTPDADILAPAAHGMLYRRGTGRLRSALDLPPLPEEAPPSRRGRPRSRGTAGEATG